MTEAVERMLPLYEAKMIHHYDHRWATYEPDGSIRDVTIEEKQDPEFVVMPRYWVEESEVNARLGPSRDRMALVGIRDICRSTDERTVICTLVPRSAVGNNLPLIVDGERPTLLVAVLSSFVLDFVARPKIGGVHLNFFIANQLPVLPPSAFDQPATSSQDTIATWLDRRVAHLVGGRWDLGTRELILAELDAAMFHLYDIDRDDADYIMETFPIVKRKDIAAHGEYHTKRLILEIYDEMAQAIADGKPYVSRLDPQEEL